MQCAIDHDVSALAAFVSAHPKLFVLTGAGVSTGSGIPAYRSSDGEWQHRTPVTHQEFIASHAMRQRYWSRSMLGYPLMRDARPNPAHAALARLEAAGHVTQLVTQNVDGLHQRAGSGNVIELHGSVHRVICMGCTVVEARAALQRRMQAANPSFAARAATASAVMAPDGDAKIGAAADTGVETDFAADHPPWFEVPACQACGGILKPDVVFFGAGVPRARLDAALDAQARADAVLIVGSSLMVYSGFRFCVRAQERGIPIAAINAGRTRADALLQLKVEGDCAHALTALADSLLAHAAA